MTVVCDCEVSKLIYTPFSVEIIIKGLFDLDRDSKTYDPRTISFEFHCFWSMYQGYQQFVTVNVFFIDMIICTRTVWKPCLKISLLIQHTSERGKIAASLYHISEKIRLILNRNLVWFNFNSIDFFSFPLLCKRDLF